MVLLEIGADSSQGQNGNCLVPELRVQGEGGKWCSWKVVLLVLRVKLVTALSQNCRCMVRVGSGAVGNWC